MNQDFVIEVGPGRQKSVDVKRAIIPSLQDLKMANPEAVTREVSRALGRSISRITVFKYLEELAQEKQIKKHIISKGERKTISIYSL